MLPGSYQSIHVLIFLSLFIARTQGGRYLRLPSEWNNPKPEDLFRSSAETVNFQPLIGILSQPGDGDGGETIHGNHKAFQKARNFGNYSYIAASYVKWVEGSGARAVPILYNEPEEVTIKKFNAINGLIFPGGGTNVEPSKFYDRAKLLWKLAIEANNRGDYFPVQGTCLGMEVLSALVAEDTNVLQLNEFNASNLPSTLQFAGKWAKNRSYFGWLTPELREKVQTEPLTIENHEDGTTLEHFLENEKLVDFFNILTTSKDRDGKVYPSTLEAKKYPVYATQWHPEKNNYEWGLSNVPHNAEAVALSQATSNFFINEARKSTHRPISEEEKDELLIYNYQPIFSGKDGKGFFDQSYVFLES